MQHIKTLFPLRVPTLSIKGIESKFPVRRVLCIGKNYADHVKEMGGSVEKDEPLWFTKPADAVIDTTVTKTIKYPPHSNNIHWEGELVVAIGKPGQFIDKKNAIDHIYGYAVGCDITARDVQNSAKNRGRPWDMAKGFDESAPIGEIVPGNQWLLERDHELTLSSNNELKQQSKLSSMIWSIPEIISELSQMVKLEAGDVIFTGTPAGVGSMKVNDSIKVTCGDLPSCEFVVVGKNKP